ncbi:MAG: ZIP family metal transporter [Methylicorpusculum sp.]|uniref:ZIP family metal transporter n=1 Tax=Methylicorpusculum sp. TaxID=2713644 RepID=UPI0027285183|nr:ZIP family metal transporter [Methylicorpusculum sp.]MDO8938848.1 ZIP family metal transporter [Methylicorpusculum sp.]MDP2180116.1 ZIP family metal transporter [Methylicorpusculum sp.]MDP2201547.1 ZIP family metal transporter [Methylicorpusculum sp.]MDP3530669.1 ZIP family metal transporter [Methylicorpusculum sp.]MDZ4154024.1 ZIP family metal transporter [Methylicorpusculum sp.]
MTTPPIATKIQQFYGSQVQKAQQSEYYKKLMDMPTPKRWMTLAGVFAASQVIVFGGLYLIFGKIVVIGFLASILAGLATGVGAIPALFFTNISRNLFNSMLGAAAGVMLAATAFSLLVPGIAYGNEIWPGNGLWVVALGMVIGALFLDIADRQLPHIHFDAAMNSQLTSLKKIWLFIIAITIHNFPEGMSVGVSFGSGDMKNGIVLATAIALQNLPEGLAVALPLVGLGYNKWRAVAIATATGLVEPVGGLLGITMVTVFSPILPIAMGFAAGAMLFVISEEIIPETHSNGRSRFATFALMIGFIIMMALDNILG